MKPQNSLLASTNQHHAPLSMNRRGFISFSACAVASMLASCGGGGSGANGAAAGSSATSPTSAAMTLSVQQPLPDTVTLDAGFASLSYEKGHMSTSSQVYFGPDNTNLIGLLNALGGGVLRIGGNSVDRITWTPEGAGRTKAQVSRIDVANLAGCIKLCPNWKVIYGINFAGARGSTSSPALAADEAAYVAQQLGSQLLAFEIGNEPDLYGGDSTQNLGGITYNIFLNGGTVAQGTIAGWNQFARAISNAVNGAVLCGPAASSDAAGWAESFATNESARIALLTEHYYISNYNNAAPSIAGMLNYPDESLVAELRSLQAAAKTAGVPFRIDEANSYFSSTKPGGVCNVFASALWAIDFIFTHAEYGASGLNFHNNGSIGSYTAIGDARGPITAVQPLFYALMFFSQIFAGGANGQLLTTALSASGAAVSAFAVATSNGATYVVVNNKDTNRRADVTIALDAPSSRATVMTLASSADSAAAQLANPGIYNGGTAITFGGQPIALDGTWQGAPQQSSDVKDQRVAVQVAPASAALIRIQ
ncbi:glycoside hydrolase family protein [Paraburkholderia antibiotica]|uniref:Beta-glucuronidase C-terminal domain-containing protein n=1 Tax=Paraburkholderia antibiotica TaxID=2728839 RepID=A0A7X9X591_9BURK|nr:hypothetical protein [Paraburkholderia antibiotica]NML31676.1 hypothetical protein [Paraburkholderia antibiotica]